MFKLALTIALFLTSTAAFAQEPQQPKQTPSQVAIAITTVINQMAQALEAQTKQIQDLQAELKAKDANATPKK